jgi:hypothetical protein
MTQAHRVYFGDIAPDALERIMEAVRAECRSDTLRWYALERANVGNGDHPRNSRTQLDRDRGRRVRVAGYVRRRAI